jgi:hypothetical protein
MTTLRLFLACLLVLPAGAGMAFAQASASTGAQNYTAPAAGNYLDEYYFDVDFGPSPVSVTLSINITNSAPLLMQPEIWVIDKLTDLPAATQYNEHSFDFGYGNLQTGAPAPAGTTGLVPIWGTGALTGFPQGPYSLSGIVRFQFTLLVIGANTTFPNDITVAFSTNVGTIVPPTGLIVPGSTNLSANIWSQSTPGTSSAFGNAGSSEYLQRNHTGVSWGIIRFGSATDELQFQVDVEMNGSPIKVALASGAFLQGGNATGTAIFELYDMRAGWDVPVATGSADATLPGLSTYDTYTTGAYTGLARFRLVVRGQNLQNVSPTNFADFWFDLIFGYNGKAQQLTAQPKLAVPRMEMTPAGTSITGTTQLSVTGGTTPVNYQWAFDGPVPSGVSLSSNTGSSVDLVVTGSFPPNTSVTVRCTNDAIATPNSEFTQQTYVLDVSLAITGPASLPNGVEGVAYGPVAFTAANGTPPYTWSVTQGTLPPGLILSTSGELSGNPSAAGTFSGIEITVTDSASDTDSAIYSIEIAPSGSVQITTTSLANGLEGDPYSANISATGGSAPYSWSIVAGALPGGLSLGTSTTDTVAISGTPSAAGSFNFTVRVEEAGSAFDEQQLTLVIDALPATVSIDTASLPGGTVGQSYSATVDASGGGSPYSWSIVSGALPDGLTLGASTGSSVAISGTPTQTGQSTFTLRVQEAGGASDERQYTITVADAPAPQPPRRTTSSSSSCAAGNGAGLAAVLLVLGALATRRRLRRA